MIKIAIVVHELYAFLHRPWRCMLGWHKWSPVTKVNGKNIIYVCGNDNDGYRVKMCCEGCAGTHLDKHVFKNDLDNPDESTHKG